MVAQDLHKIFWSIVLVAVKLFKCYARRFLISIIFFCQAVDDKLKEHVKGVEAAQSKQVHLFWCGMAEVS